MPKIPKLLLALIVIVIVFLMLRFIPVLAGYPPFPSSVMNMYMTVVAIIVLLTISFSEKGAEGLAGPIKSLLGDPDKKVMRSVAFVIFPLLVGFWTYSSIKPKFEAPVQLRVQHPAPPASVKLFKKMRSLQSLKNPYRVEDKEQLKKNIQEGGVVYYNNCFPCHGDKLDGLGHFAGGFNPLPVNFTDPGMILQLQEAFVFWRISTGGPGLPSESTPWLSAMPIWQDILTEEEVWKVILFIYDYTGFVPRSWE